MAEVKLKIETLPANQYFPPTCALKVMATKVPLVGEKDTIGDVEKMLIQRTREFESINYIYITNAAQKLLGVISIKELFRQPKEVLVSQVMKKELISVRPSTNRERAAYLAVKNNIKAVPVVDKDNKFLGVVSSDTVLSTIYQEGREDIFHLAGIHRAEVVFDNILELPLIKALKHRLPWLLLGLLGGIIVAGIVKSFENTLSKNLILAAFIPLIIYMADAVRIQMEAFIIRDCAINPKINFKRYFLKQFSIIFLIGILISFALFVVSLILYQRIDVGIVLSVALFAAIISSLLTGLVIPYIFNKLKLDPANASGPIATIIQDVASVLIYFSIASFIL